MIHLLQVLDNALLQGLTMGVGVLGLAVAFRVLRYPDLTPDGSFLIGAAVFAAFLLGEVPGGWPVALGAAVIAGGLAGWLTAALRSIIGVNRLLTGILTTMIAYSLAFRILGGRPNQGLGDSAALFSGARALEPVGGERAPGSSRHVRTMPGLRAPSSRRHPHGSAERSGPPAAGHGC